MAKQDTEVLVKVGGWFLGFAEKLMAELARLGVSSDDIYGFVKKGGDVPVRKIAEELAKLMVVAKEAIPFKHDQTRQGWALLEDVPFDGKQFVPEIVEFLKPAESNVNGRVMKQRAKELNAHLGQHHAEYLLEHQELIPKEWRGKYILVFPGTVWRGSDGRRYVPYLGWDGRQWWLSFGWLEGGWRGDDRLVSLRK